MHMRKLTSSNIFWLVVVGGVALLARLLLILLYQPVSYSDTASYRRLADTVLNRFTAYDGTRTPGYPVFMALVGSDRHVWLAQLALGLVTTLLLFYIGLKLTDKPWFGAAIALAHTLNLGQLFFESSLLTESLTTFLMVLTMGGALLWLSDIKKRTAWLALFLSISAILTFLVRPLFIYLPFYLLFFLGLVTWVDRKKQARQQELQTETPVSRISFPVRLVVVYLIPVVLLAGGWLSFMHKNFNEWSITTMTGYHLVQHTGSFFEYVPDQYAKLRDTYIKYRDAQIAQYGTQTNAIWDAIPEMSKVSGYSFYALSRVLARISIQLIVEHPFMYLKNAALGWWMFWRAPVYWSAEALRFPWMAGPVRLLVQLERYVMIAINMLFILTSILFSAVEIISSLRRKPSPLAIREANPTLYAFLWLLLGNIWIASILQTLLDHGDNPRFLVPLQSLVILWVAAFIFQLVSSRLSVKPITMHS
jgi:hypothetical protein